MDVRWSAPSHCPSRAQFIAAIELLVGSTLAITPGAAWVIDATLHHDGGTYHLDLRVETSDTAPASTRHLEAPDCETLVEAGSLAVGARIIEHPPQGAAPEESEPEPGPVVPPPRSDPRAAEFAPDPAPTRSGPQPQPVPDAGGPPRAASNLRAAAGIFGGIDYGSQPGLAGVLRGELSLLGTAWRASAVAQHGFATTAQHETTDQAVRVNKTGGGIRGCWAPSVGRAEFATCAGIDLHRLRGEGAGSIQTRARSQGLWVALPLGLTAAWAVAPSFALRATVEVPIALRRPGFHVTDGEQTQTLFRSLGAGFVALIGIEVRLPG